MISSDNNRTKKYQKSKTQENVLEVMNQALSPKELELISNFDKPKYPIIFIVGAQRSGTTVLMQLITQLFNVSYPNNFIARYWDAPYIGAMLYKNLSDNLDNNTLDFNSDLGYTIGLQGPHEFGYFWKKWFPWKSWEEPQYEKIDYSLLQKELAAWQNVNDNALIFKNLTILDSNIEILSKIFPNAFFVNVERDPIFNCQSTYQSRVKLFGNDKEWFGVKPPEYTTIKKLSIAEQIVYQIFYTRQNINKQLQKIENNRFVTISYESFTENPNKILESLYLQIFEQKKSFNLNLKLENTNSIKTDKAIFNKFSELCNKIFTNEKNS